MEGNIGDKVLLHTKEGDHEGVLMPSKGTNIIIKLSSGYNIAIDKNKISKIEIVEKFEEAPSKNKAYPKSHFKPKEEMPNILILHTGGTIASKVDYRTGGVVPRFSPEEIIELYPELRDIANIKASLLSNILSENMTFEHMEKIAEAIDKEYKNNKALDGIIVTHGTDVMHFTSAALSFMLKNIPIPIILVGAQRSSDRGSSDALMNLICAAKFISDGKFKGVAICMHRNSGDVWCSILQGTKARKMHASRRDTFRPINIEPIALVNYETGKIKYGHQKFKTGEYEPKLKLEKKVGLVKTYPGMNPKIFEAFKGYKGLIIEGTGLGHAPVIAMDKESKNNEEIKKVLSDLIKSGVFVVMTTQTTYGSVQMNVYSCGRELLDMGVKQGKLMTETALMKLAYLFGNYKSKEDVERLFNENLVGEMFDRIEEDTFLI